MFSCTSLFCITVRVLSLIELCVFLGRSVPTTTRHSWNLGLNTGRDKTTDLFTGAYYYKISSSLYHKSYETPNDGRVFCTVILPQGTLNINGSDRAIIANIFKD
jgi:hypothetical protein